jgi:hypothetical protein
MAVEPKRGCGFRKVGGLYLVGPMDPTPCDRLPLPLQVCRACGHGIKQSRGWTWCDVAELTGGRHPGARYGEPCLDRQRNGSRDLFCDDPAAMGRAGLLWIGEQFYPRPVDFVAEGFHLGLSRRIRAIPRDFEIGKTWVLLAHPKAVLDFTPGPEPAPVRFGLRVFKAVLDFTPGPEPAPVPVDRPGIFMVWLPRAMEKIVTETQARDETEMAKLRAQGITPVVVPDDDPDHQGSVHDKAEAKPENGDAE